MFKSKLWNLFFLLVFLTSLVGSNTFTVSAEPPTPPDKPEKITQADREAAAARAADAGLTLDATAITTMDMAMAGDAPRYFSHPNYANSPLPSNVVADWNAFVQEFLQPTPMPGMPMTMGPVSMAQAFVYLAYTQAAVYDALVAIEGGFTPYTAAVMPGSDPTASREAAVAAAAYGVLANYFPLDGTLPLFYASSLAAIPDGASKTAGIAIGEAAAAGILTLRTGDVLTGDGGYVILPPGPGVWEPTLLLPDGTYAAPWDAWMKNLQPFLRTNIAEYTSQYSVPPVLGDPEYASNDPEYLLDFAEVKETGTAMSPLRTAEMAETAKFWTTNMVIQTQASYRQLAQAEGLNLLETARLMAMGNMIATDSLIATYDTKYLYSFWRPVTAINHTNPDGTYSPTVVDPLNPWMPAEMTPNFPEYMAGHGSFVSSQAALYEALLGPTFNVTLSSMATGTMRTYTSAAEMRTEIENARTWGGMHFRSSTETAVLLGQQLASEALTTHFLPDPASDRQQHVIVSGGIRKFVDELPMLCAPAAGVDCTGNGTPTLDQYLPVAVPEVVTVGGVEADYYEIAVVQYREQMHSDLPGTLLRGYVQVSTTAVPGEHVQLSNDLLDGTSVDIPGFFGVTPPHYLGPTIVATKDRPVRIKFYNLLPTGVAGDLFIPVDTTVMGSGMGPDLYPMVEMDPQNPKCGMAYDDLGNRTPKPDGCYTENRATLHLHGGISPWISDGTPHQWITPANDPGAYPQGVSVSPVPDMGDSGAPDDGVMTFYYTNQQSARLMFYHDHSWGITRLNVYAGEAAPYIITDAAEASLLNQGLLPGADSTIPLVIQDKTFVPSESQLAVSDETWDIERWGGPGNLWLPHVYSPAQNPGDSSGVNQFGRWAYGPWFWPPTSNIEYGPIPNAYYDPACDPNVQWCEPELMPGVPFNSMGMEAFMDTPVVNGTVYPTLTVDPKTYRFRILNAANDRFFNLSFYQAVDANGVICDANNTAPAPSLSGVTCTEAPLNPAEVLAALDDPTVHPTPLLGTEGPSWIQVGTEGGFLPAPTVIPAQPTTWVNDPTVFNAGNVDLHSLLMGPAERADVIVDFSAFAGQTLILYNDAPAAFPARDPRYDYYTGNGDYRDTGGAPSTLPGYGPNTRTVMQIKVAAADPAAPAPAYNLLALETAFLSTSLGGQGVFETSQHPIVVGQGAYNSAYGTSFQDNGPQAGLVQIFDTSLTFETLLTDTAVDGDELTMPLKPKQIQDEMGEAFDPEYGRMSGFLGLETPNATAGAQNMLLYGFVMPPTEVLRSIDLPPGVALEPIAATNDGTQIWKVTHNGVDTHPIHFHLYDVQLINRVGWDGIIRKPEANELGWKDTVRISPLEDTIVALRPLVPNVPWDLPNSVRLLDPSMPDGAPLDMGMVIFDPSGEPVEIFNHTVNFGWEYVWHCHILSHEEMDMMRPVVVGVTPNAPSLLTATLEGNGNNRGVDLAWVDNSLNETAFTVQRAASLTGPWTDIAVLPANTIFYNDPIGNTNTAYAYRVIASNTVGDTAVYAAPSIGFPNETMVSLPSETVMVGTVPLTLPAAPTNLSAAFQTGPQIALTWTDNATNETGFVIERALDGVNFSVLVTVAARNNTGSVSYIDTNVAPGVTYTYRVAAINLAGQSAYSNLASASVPAPPASPAPVLASAVRINNRSARVTLTWTNVANETGYEIQRSTSPDFTANLVIVNNIGADVTTYTTGNLPRFTAFYFRVRAVNGAGVSAWANASPFPILTP